MVATLPAPAFAQEQSFAIAPGALADALTAFGQQSGLQISFPAALTAGRRSPGASGTLTAEQALAQLLAGSGLSYSFANATTVSIYDPAGEATAADGSILLEEVNVVGVAEGAASGSGFQGTPDWVYESPASVSVVSREAIVAQPARNARDLLDSVAGVYINRSEAQNPGMTISIRGLEDQNRIATMIDGARQNFQRSGHGASQRTYVDTAFIRQIDVEKTAGSGVGSAASMGGSVNFRTVSADDIIAAGSNWGVEINASTGTNAFNFDGSVIGSYRMSDAIAVTAGFSGKDIGAYAIGGNGDLALISEYDDDGAAVFTGQQTGTSFLKGEFELTPDMTLTLAWMRNHGESSQGTFNGDGELSENAQDIVNSTLTANFAWKPADELIDLKANFYINDLDNAELRTTYYGGGDPIQTPVDYALTTFGGSIENTSRFVTPLGDLAVNYGVEGFRDDGETTTEDLTDTIDGYDGHYGFGGANPSGVNEVFGSFVNATLEHDDWLTASLGLRYDHAHLAGSTVVHGYEVVVLPRECLMWLGTLCISWGPDRTETSYPAYDVEVDREGGALLPNAMLAAKVTDWLQPFVSYSQSYRAPSVMESLVSGGHPYVAPVENAPNPYLGPERGETWEAGVNISADDVLAAGDALRIKAVAFQRNIENYISYGTDIYFEPADRTYSSYVNLNGTTRMHGIELEANYDAGAYYIGGTLSWLETEFPDTYTYNGVSYDARPSVLFVPPKLRVNLDAGVRLFDEKLTLGGRIAYVGKSDPAYGQLAGNYVTDEYTTYDVYAAYEVSENATLRAAITNLTDLAYVPALADNNVPAPGRTVTLSLNAKF